MYEFTVGNVIRRTFALIGRHSGSLAVAAALLAFLPNLASPWSGSTSLKTLDTAQGLQVSSSTYTPLGSAGSIVVWVLGLVLYGIVVRIALDDERGRPSDSASWIAASLRAFLPNLGIYILEYVAISIGFMLLIVPGLMLVCAWSVVIPINMAEGTGVWRVFGRSRALTAGHRWRILGLLLLYAASFVVIGGLGILGITESVGHDVNGASIWVTKVAISALSAVLSLIGSAGTTAIYLELRSAEGSAASPDLVSAFE